MSQSSRVFGIDLGTTYSCIAYVDDLQRPIVVPNSIGDRKTPSVVQFAGNERIVGKEAKDNRALYPDNTIAFIERYMGKNTFSFPYNGVNYTPEEISAYILRKLVLDAEQYTGMKITDVVITCPASFGIPERDAIKKAGEIAGLNVRSIINDAMAAAISYSVNERPDQVVLVYDLGGGMFDVTIIEFKAGDFTIICVKGDHYLGGSTWDENVVAYLAQEWQVETDSTEDPLDSFETVIDLLLKVEQAKHALTKHNKTNIRVVHKGRTAKVTLTREKFDELTAHLLESTIDLMKQALALAEGKGCRRFDELLLVGGSTHMPQVARRLRQEFNIEPNIYEPDEAVVKGAAIYGQKLALNQEIKIKITEAMGVSEDKADIESIDIRVLEAAQREVAQDSGLQIDSVKGIHAKKILNVSSQSFGIIIDQPPPKKDTIVQKPPSTVYFTAYYPHEVVSNCRYGLFVYAHIDSVRAIIREDIQQFTEKLGGSALEPQLARDTSRLRSGASITITPRCDEVEFYPPSITEDWNGELNRFDFEFELVNSSTRLFRGWIEISTFNIVVSSIEFVLTASTIQNESSEVVNSLAAAKFRSASAKLYQRIFVSYSRKDTEIVEAYRVAQLALGNDVFIDTYSIRTGEDWQVALAKAIDDAEIFQLFWSDNSAASPNVRDEWEYALKYRCLESRCENFIRPVYWSDSLLTPPSELSHLNFRHVSFKGSYTARNISDGASQNTSGPRNEGVAQKRFELQIASLVVELNNLKELLKNIVHQNQQLLSEVYDLKSTLGKSEKNPDVETVENIITSMATLPMKMNRSFTTSYDNQQRISIRFMESSLNQAEYISNLGQKIGQLDIDLPSGVPAGTNVELTIELNESGILAGTVSIPAIGNEYKIELKTAALSTEEMDFVRDRARSIRIE